MEGLGKRARRDFAGEARALRAFVEAGDVAGAERFLRDLVAECPQESWPCNELVWLLHKQADWPAALHFAEIHRSLRPDNASGYAVGIAAHRQLGNLDAAAGLLDLAASKFVGQEWLGRARRDLDKAIDLASPSRQLRERLTKATAEARWQDAGALAAQLRASFPDDPGGYTGGVKALRAEGRVREASALQREAATRFPSDAVLHAEGARIAGDVQDFELESQLWTRHRAQFPQDGLGWLLGARALHACTDYAAAEALLAQAISQFTANEPFYRLRARLAELRLDWNAADAHWQAAMQVFPDHSEIFLEWATLFSRPRLLADQKHAVTIERLRNGLTLWPGAIAFWVALIRTLKAAGRASDADAALAQAGMHCPDSAELLLLRAEMQAAAGDAAQAIITARAVAMQQGSGRDALLTFVRILLQAREFQEAERVCNSALARFPADRDFLKSFALAAERRGDYRLASGRWQSAAAAFPRDWEFRRNLTEAQIHCHAVGEGHAIGGGDAARPGNPAEQDGAFEQALAASFESLGGTGQGCEFGVVQRQFGIEPLGLLRWTTILPDQLTKALVERFEGVGDPGQTVVETYTDSGAREYCARDARFGMLMHTFLSEADIPHGKAVQLITLRSRFLRRTFLESLALHDKIYVYKIWGRALSAAELDALFAALSSYGPNWLLYVRLADAEHAAGTVEHVRPRLLVGYITRFSMDAGGTIQPVDVVCWRTLCMHAKRIRDADVRGAGDGTGG